MQRVKQNWEESFAEQIAKQAYNTAPVEAVVRTVSYYLRDRAPGEPVEHLHFLELGCGAGPNLVWLAQKGIKVSGVDISPSALNLARENLERTGCAHMVGDLHESSVAKIPIASESIDGIIEACVFQHLDREDRQLAFGEVRRLLKPGGLFVGYMLDVGHTVFKTNQHEQLADDPGTLVLADGGSKLYLTNIGSSHFFTREEIVDFLDGFADVDPCLTTYYLPVSEARRRGYSEYLQSMWTVYAIK